MLQTAQLLPQRGFRRWASTRPVTRPSRQPATGPPGSYPDGTHTRWRRRAYVRIRSPTGTTSESLGARRGSNKQRHACRFNRVARVGIGRASPEPRQAQLELRLAKIEGDRRRAGRPLWACSLRLESFGVSYEATCITEVPLVSSVNPSSVTPSSVPGGAKIMQVMVIRTPVTGAPPSGKSVTVIARTPP